MTRVLFWFALLVALLLLAGNFLPVANAWGFHHYAFLPRPVGLIAGLVILALFLPRVGRGLAQVLDPLARALESPRSARWIAVAAVAAFAVLFYLGRQSTFLLSDGALLVRGVNQGFINFTVDTLAAVIQLWVHYLLDRFLGVTSGSASFRIVAIVSGVVWLAALFAVTGRLTRSGWIRLLLGGLLATAGVTKLFYGYVETSPLVAAAVGVYVWAAVRLIQDGRGIVPATAAFLGVTAMHVTGLLALPSFIYAAGRWAGRHRGRWLTAGGLCLVPAVLYMGLWFSRGGTVGRVQAVYAPYFSEMIPLVGPLDSKQAYTLFSLPRLTEFLNEQIFIGPFALLALVLVLIAARRSWGAWPPVWRLLALLLAPFLLLSLVFNRKLGGARDWDLVATVAVPSVLLTVLFLASKEGAADPAVVTASGKRRDLPALAPLTVALLAVSAWHTAGSVLVDAAPSRSVARVLALFDAGAPVSNFARSYALEEVGHHYVEIGRAADSQVYFEQAVRSDPSNIKATSTLGAIYSVQGRQIEALALLREAVRQRPEVALNHYNLASASAQAGDWPAAAVGYFQALKLNPSLTPAYTGLGTAYSRLNMLAPADSVARAGLRLFPDAVDLHALRGAVQERLGHPDSAIVAYQRALQLDPNNEIGLFNAGRLMVDAGRDAEAIPLLERLVERNPRDAESLVNLGVAYLQVGRKDEAIQAFSRAIAANPRLQQAYFNLVTALHSQGKDEQAIHVLEAFQEQDSLQAARLNVPLLIEQLRASAPRTGGSP